MTSDRGDRIRESQADYVQVGERLIAFKEAYPQGRLQSEIVHWSDSRVIVKALAYRTEDDKLPGIGHSWLEVPGRTPYTRGSELENAETSAWGRALAAIGLEVKRGISTREERQSKERPAEPRRNAPSPRRVPDRPTGPEPGETGADWPQNPREVMEWALAKHGLGGEQVLEILKIDGGRLAKLTHAQLERATHRIDEAIGTPAPPDTEEAQA